MTPSDLKHATLRKLKVITTGDNASPEDFAAITEKYEGLHATLIVMELATWALTEDIPDEAAEAMKQILAAWAADEFGVPEPRASILKAEGGLNLAATSPAERLLRRALAPKHVRSTVRSEYF